MLSCVNGRGGRRVASQFFLVSPDSKVYDALADPNNSSHSKRSEKKFTFWTIDFTKDQGKEGMLLSKMISRDHFVCPVSSFSEMKEIG